MFVDIREVPQEGKPWVTSGGLVRLQALDKCDVDGIDEIEEFITFALLRTALNAGVPMRWRVDDRELVLVMRDPAGVENN